jgi:hypothetical protein
VKLGAQAERMGISKALGSKENVLLEFKVRNSLKLAQDFRVSTY